VVVDVEDVLRRQAGVVGRDQALAAGMSSAAISARVAKGRWRTLHPGVYLDSHYQVTDEARVRAALLWAGPDATVSGVAAAWWYGMWESCPSIVEVTVPRARWPRARSGVRVRRRDLNSRDRAEHQSVAVTAPELTALEAAVALGDDGVRLLDRALQRHVSFGAVVRAHHRNIGRRGSRAAWMLLTVAGDRADSQAERVLKGLLRQARLSGWQRAHRVGGYEVDFAFVEEQVAIEVDGWAWHSDPARFRRDRERQNNLVLSGWTVLRFTWHDLTQDANRVITTIRSALRRAAAA
jgi:very-short-patch-repair endonuclease